MLEFLAAHPWVSLLVLLPLVLATGSAAAAVVGAPFKQWSKVAIARERRVAPCPRCDGSGCDPDELERLRKRVRR